MIRMSFAVLFLLVVSYVSAAQDKAMPCNVLEAILKENDFGYEKSKNIVSTYEYDTLGNVIEKIHEQGKISKRVDAKNKIILIDTFRFFTPHCSGLYGNNNIEIRNSPLPLNEQKQNLKNLFWVTGIGTGKENAFCISIMRQVYNEVFIYYLSILGYDVKVIKKKGGDF